MKEEMCICFNLITSSAMLTHVGGICGWPVSSCQGLPSLDWAWEVYNNRRHGDSISLLSLYSAYLKSTT
jgi:hypothetical protein